MDGYNGKKLLSMDDLGYPYFRKPPNSQSSQSSQSSRSHDVPQAQCLQSNRRFLVQNNSCCNGEETTGEFLVGHDSLHHYSGWTYLEQQNRKTL